MKTQLFPILFVVFFIACSKADNTKQINTMAKSNLETLQQLPLNDLGTDTFFGYTGGLYPDGLNTPSGQYATDLLNISKSIVPLDVFGRPSSAALAKVIFISLGGSTGGKNMHALIEKTINNPATNSRLKLLACNEAGFDAYLNAIADPDNIYWDHVSQVITGNSSTYKQVQVVYLETDDSTTKADFPARPLTIKKDIETCMRTLKHKFQNLKVVYLLARTRTFGKKNLPNREPNPYFFGWACKWAIEDQINGVPGIEYKGDNAVAPIITWGFYQWAWTTPRKTDGFFWVPSESSDGLHATPEGQDTLSRRFQNFLLTDKYAKKWYAAH